VPFVVVDGLEVVDVDEREQERNAETTRALQLAFELAKADAAQGDAGELVDPYEAALALGLRTITGGCLSKRGRVGPGARGALAVGSRRRTVGSRTGVPARRPEVAVSESACLAQRRLGRGVRRGPALVAPRRE